MVANNSTAPNLGAPGREQFADAHTQFRNQAIMAYVGELMLLREEYVGDDTLATRNGFDDQTLDHFTELVKNVDQVRRDITDNSTGTDLRTLIPDATDPAQNITTAAQKAVATGPKAAAIKKPAGAMAVLPYALDGSDSNIPLNSQLNIRNPLARVILHCMDNAIVQATRYEDRFLTATITPQTSLMMFAELQNIVLALNQFGGGQNRVLVTSGTRRSEEPRGANAAPNAAGEAPLPMPAAPVANPAPAAPVAGQ